VKKNAPKIVVISFWQRNKIGISGYGGAFSKNVHDQNASKLLSQLGSGFWGHGFCLNTVQSATIPLSFADF